MVHIPYTQPKKKKRPKEYKSPIVYFNSVGYSNGELSCQSKKAGKDLQDLTNQREPQATLKNPTQSLREKMANLLKEN